MRAQSRVVAARAAIEFGRVLDGLKIVGHRDDGEEDRDEHRQRDHLKPPACAFAWSIAKPQPHNDGCQKYPGEIEDDLHSLPEFYMST